MAASIRERRAVTWRWTFALSDLGAARDRTCDATGRGRDAHSARDARDERIRRLAGGPRGCAAAIGAAGAAIAVAAGSDSRPDATCRKPNAGRRRRRGIDGAARAARRVRAMVLARCRQRHDAAAVAQHRHAARHRAEIARQRRDRCTWHTPRRGAPTMHRHRDECQCSVAGIVSWPGILAASPASGSPCARMPRAARCCTAQRIRVDRSGQRGSIGLTT